MNDDLVETVGTGPLEFVIDTEPLKCIWNPDLAWHEKDIWKGGGGGGGMP